MAPPSVHPETAETVEWIEDGEPAQVADADLRDAVRVLAQHGRVAPVTIHQRIDFAASMIDGRTVGELNPQSRSTQEIADLWKYVKTQISKCVRRS